MVRLDGQDVGPPRGAKPWGLLAYLASTPRSHPRSDLAELLFCEAADPLGALRWNLAALRRLLDRPDSLKGDSISLDLHGAFIDSQELEAGNLAVFDPGVADLLLAGLSFADSPNFEIWLAGERARLLRIGTSLLRGSALRALATGDHEVAVSRASGLVLLDPLDEGHQALLIRAHATAGDATAAQAQYVRCCEILRRELSIEPGNAVVAAAHLAATLADTHGQVDLPSIDARMSVAWQSFLAGSVDHGVDLGRSVVAMADRDEGSGLRIMARLFFASMLSIAVRSWDESATTATEALGLAELADSRMEEGIALGILAGIELMRADYRMATHHATLGCASSVDPGTRAINLTFLAAVEADIGQGTLAAQHALEAVALAEESADPMRIAYATAYAGLAFLLDDEIESARSQLERSVEVMAPMLVLLPWPLALLAEVEVRTGNVAAAAKLAARAAAISSTTGIDYQRGLALRAQALVDVARGDGVAAVEKPTVALSHARRTTAEGYAFHWPIAWILDSLARVTASVDPTASHQWADALLEHATSVGMYTFTHRAELLLGEE